MPLPQHFNPAANPEGIPEWPSDLSEDYAKADDETRRRILLSAGYDSAHKLDAFRLFPELASSIPAQNGPPQQHQQNKSHINSPKDLCFRFIKRFWKLFCGLAVIVGFISCELVSRFFSWLMSLFT